MGGAHCRAWRVGMVGGDAGKVRGWVQISMSNLAKKRKVMAMEREELARSRRRSSHVPLLVLGAAGATLLIGSAVDGCDNTQRCVDNRGRIVADAMCHSGSGGGGFGAPMPGYRYMYGGMTGGRVGDAVVGGASTSGGVRFGGFGGGGEGGGGE